MNLLQRRFWKRIFDSHWFIIALFGSIFGYRMQVSFFLFLICQWIWFETRRNWYKRIRVRFMNRLAKCACLINILIQKIMKTQGGNEFLARSVLFFIIISTELHIKNTSRKVIQYELVRECTCFFVVACKDCHISWEDAKADLYLASSFSCCSNISKIRIWDYNHEFHFWVTLF